MDPTPKENLSTDKAKAALLWYSLGYKVIPITSGKKIPSVSSWKQWVMNLTRDAVRDHWKANPNDDIAVYCGSELAVLDADTEQSLAAMQRLEKEFLIAPFMRAKTTQGSHHFFRVPEDVQLRAGAFGSEKYPERIDIKHKEGYVLVAPSTGKTMETDLFHVSKLADISQEFADALAKHNGQHMVNMKTPLINESDEEVSSEDEPLEIMFTMGDEIVLDRVKSILSYLDPDEEGYQSWVKTLAAIFNCTCGSDYGLELADAWSQKGEKYKGRKEVEQKWRSFRADYEHQSNFNTLLQRVLKVNPNWIEEQSEREDPFEVVTTVYRKPTIKQNEPASHPEPEQSTAESKTPESPKFENPFAPLAINDIINEIEENALPQVPILMPIALSGEITVIIAAPNSGKTLLTFFMIREGIREKRFDPARIMYVNFDDTQQGLITKGKIANDFGFYMMAPGFRGANVEKVIKSMREAVDQNKAQGVVLIFDTLKKFVDVMEKRDAKDFFMLCREFVNLGGTVIALAHTNKDGVTPGGVSDIIDDPDMAWTLTNDGAGGPFVKATFSSNKHRGTGSASLTFLFDRHSPMGYLDRLETVSRVEEGDDLDFSITPKKSSSSKSRSASTAKQDPEERLVQIITEILNDSEKTKTALIAEAKEKSRESRAKVEGTIEKYCGSDPLTHKWNRRKGSGAAWLYYLL
jgi:hypothetical protein